MLKLLFAWQTWELAVKTLSTCFFVITPPPLNWKRLLTCKHQCTNVCWSNTVAIKSWTSTSRTASNWWEKTGQWSCKAEKLTNELHEWKQTGHVLSFQLKSGCRRCFSVRGVMEEQPWRFTWVKAGVTCSSLVSSRNTPQSTLTSSSASSMWRSSWGTRGRETWDALVIQC